MREADQVRGGGGGLTKLGLAFAPAESGRAAVQQTSGMALNLSAWSAAVVTRPVHSCRRRPSPPSQPVCLLPPVLQPYGDDRVVRRPMLQSVVAPVEGDPHDGYEQSGRRKRAAGGELHDEKPDVKRRNQRLFGAILGTLQRFR